MKLSSHKIRLEERKVFRRLIISVAVFIVAIFIIIYAGIPLLTKTIIFFTSFRKENNVALVLDNMIINSPIIDPLPEATNSSPITVSGMADKERTVKISVNDVEIAKVLADKDAKFTSKNVRLSEGANTIVAVTFKDDKESSPSTPLIIIYKKNLPKIDIYTPSEGQKFIAESKDIIISGETDPGNKVTINDRFIIVNQDGKFNYKVTLSDGDNTFKIVATDIAGNQTIMERKVTYSP